VTINSLGITLPATISFVSQSAISSGGISYFEVNVALPYVEGLKIGMSLEVEMLKAAANDVVLVEVSALNFDENNNAYVLVETSEETSEQRAVTVGIQDGKHAQILEGLEVGERVVVPSTSSSQDFTAMSSVSSSQTSSVL
jgi:multidrug efflux pump subunit AcrA (membrane-fusion protein)